MTPGLNRSSRTHGGEGPHQEGGDPGPKAPPLRRCLPAHGARPRELPSQDRDHCTKEERKSSISDRHLFFFTAPQHKIAFVQAKSTEPAPRRRSPRRSPPYPRPGAAQPAKWAAAWPVPDTCRFGHPYRAWFAPQWQHPTPVARREGPGPGARLGAGSVQDNPVTSRISPGSLAVPTWVPSFDT